MFYEDPFYVVIPCETTQSKVELEEFIFKISGKRVPVQDFSSYSSGLCIVRTDLKFDEVRTTNITCMPYAGKQFRSVAKFIDWYENMYLLTRNLQVVVHLPHTSLELPQEYYDCVRMPKSTIEKYNCKMSDLGVDRVFPIEKDWIRVSPKYSRIYCDVERFKNDEDEPMAKLGQGYRYKKFYDGTKIPFLTTNKFRTLQKAQEEYYDSYHEEFDNLVQKLFNRGKDVLILDVHSYSDEMAISTGRTPPFPDICIGFDENFYDKRILDLIIERVNKLNLTYELNRPYSGSFVPNAVYKGQLKGKVYSFMIEINKRLYL